MQICQHSDSCNNMHYVLQVAILIKSLLSTTNTLPVPAQLLGSTPEVPKMIQGFMQICLHAQLVVGKYTRSPNRVTKALSQRRRRWSGQSGLGRTTFQRVNVVGLIPRLHRHPRVAKYACVYDVQLLAIWRIRLQQFCFSVKPYAQAYCKYKCLESSELHLFFLS